MAVVVKKSQPEENELICGVSSDCVVLQPVKLEPEPVNFISVNNGIYEASTNISELYSCQSNQPTYQELSSYQTFSSDNQLVSGDVYHQPQSEVYSGQDVYAATEDYTQIEPSGYTVPEDYSTTEPTTYPDTEAYTRLEPPIYNTTEEFPPTEPVATDPSEHSSSTLSVPVQDYYDIQVAEEEVVSDNWNVDHTEVVVEDSKPQAEAMKSSDDVEIPLSQDQDIYSQMHPYPCDFCSRRFSKKSTLMSHMVSHQTERFHGCNLCGARYRRKSDLVNHMKTHAYPPPRYMLDEEEDDLRSTGGVEGSKGRRKKAQSLAPKKNSFSSDISEPVDFKEEKKLGKNRVMKKNSKSLLPKSMNYVDEDMRLLSEMSQNSDIVNQVPRWPVVDQSRPYVCQHCGVGFAREKALASHSRIHGGDSPFECDVCGEMFWDVSLLREHARSKHPHIDASPATSTGTETGAVYTGDDRFGTFFCETCGVSFHRLDLLKKHRRSHLKIEQVQEVGDDDHVCTVCGQFFENASELRTHAEIHTQETHRCMACGARFQEASELSEHVRTNHTDHSQETTCTLCGKVCKDKRALAKHACTLSDNRSFPCYSCNKRFHSRARLRRHMVSHRDKAVSCSDCGEEFPDGRALMSHRHSHNSSNSHPTRSFPCHDCGKTFGSRSSQQIHVRIHTGERPYGCRFCWKAFADGGTLRKHERIHTGEKPYVCPVCPKAFNQRVVLREHIRAHHSGSDSKVNSCYECKVCGYLFSSSSELCVHLVQHSDENTAKHRLPSMGPRKYKRRRKLGPASPSKVSPSLDFESTDSSDSTVDKTKKIIKKKYSYDSPPPSQELGNAVVQSFENAIQNINSIVVKSEPKKQKLDKALKKHKTKALSKLTKMARIEKRAKAAKLMNNTSYASKYVVSRPNDMRPVDGQLRPRTKNVTYPFLEDSFETILNGSDAIRNRPRTKNVNYHNLKVPVGTTKLEPATFPITKSRNKKSRVRKTFTKKEKTKSISSRVLNGSKQNENSESIGGESTVVSEEKLETCIVDDFNIEGVHNEVKPEEMQHKIEPVMIKSEMLTCEMCGDGFVDRSELLAHIRVHI